MLLLLLFVSCGGSSGGSSGKQGPSDLPQSPTDLPKAQADLTLSGAIEAHLTEVRAQDCGPYRSGGQQVFHASQLFQWRGTWYALSATSDYPVRDGKVVPPAGYSGPGSYTATLYMRELVVGSGGLVTGKRIWWNGYRHGPVVTVSSDQRGVAIRGADPDPADPNGYLLVFTPSAELWPTPPGLTAPFPSPVPSPDQLVLMSGSWRCL